MQGIVSGMLLVAAFAAIVAAAAVLSVRLLRATRQAARQSAPGEKPHA
jgi:hypothetical protein